MGTPSESRAPHASVAPITKADEFAAHFRSPSTFTIHLGSPQGPTYYLQRPLLASRSPYFSALFSFPGSESSSNSVTLSHTIDHGAFKRFLYYIYTGELPEGGSTFEKGQTAGKVIRPPKEIWQDMERQVLLYAKLYVLADCFLMEPLKMHVMKVLRQTLGNCYITKSAATKAVPEAVNIPVLEGMFARSASSPFGARPAFGNDPSAFGGSLFGTGSPTLLPATPHSPKPTFKPRVTPLSTPFIIDLTKFVYSNTPSRTPRRHGTSSESTREEVHAIDPLRGLLVEYLLSVLPHLKKNEAFLALLAGESEETEEDKEEPSSDSGKVCKDGSYGLEAGKGEAMESKDISEWGGDLARDLMRGLPMECQGEKVKS